MREPGNRRDSEKKSSHQGTCRSHNNSHNSLEGRPAGADWKIPLSFICVPMISADEVTGMISLQDLD